MKARSGCDNSYIMSPESMASTPKIRGRKLITKQNNSNGESQTRPPISAWKAGSSNSRTPKRADLPPRLTCVPYHNRAAWSSRAPPCQRICSNTSGDHQLNNHFIAACNGSKTPRGALCRGGIIKSTRFTSTLSKGGK